MSHALTRTGVLWLSVPFLVISLGTGSVDAQTCVAQPSGLLSYWPADINADDVADGNDGTLVGASLVPGFAGQAFDLGGELDYVTVPDATNLHFTSADAYTIEFWVKTDPVPSSDMGHRTLVEKWRFQALDGYPFAIRLNTFSPTNGPPGTVNCGAFDGVLGNGNGGGGNFPVAQSIATIDDGQFHHVACVYDHSSSPKSIQVFIDGRFENEDTYSTLLDITNDTELRFGLRGNTIPKAATDFDGLLDEVSIYSRALADWEIEAIFKGSSSAKCDVPVPLDISTDTINLAGKGVISVAILTTESFDAIDVDSSTILFGPSLAVIAHSAAHLQDVDGDGDLDLLLHFRKDESGIQCGDTVVSLSAETFGGDTIGGSDAIQTKCK